MDFVHRDIKPQNVLLVGGELRLADFGLVKNLNPSARSVTSAPPGTPIYRAPEQEKGEEVLKPADVYSLGIVLMELVTGTRPEPKIDATEGSTLDQYRNTRKLPGHLQQQNANLLKLPQELRQLIYRCTNVLPERRPPHAGALLEEFETVIACLTHLPCSDEPVRRP